MYAQILVNHAFARKMSHLTYKIPEENSFKIGDGVIVPFQKGEKPGIVLGISPRLNDSIDPAKIKSVSEEKLKEERLLWPWQIDLISWASEYYFCSYFDLVKLFLPKHIWRMPKRERKSAVKTRPQKAIKQHPLTEEQAAIVKDFSALSPEAPQKALLRGITGSGKTEIYKALIQKQILAGKQAILLVPEIALTPQLMAEFEGLVPNLEVIHSRLSDGKRAQAWRSIQAGTCPLVIGSRSALFSPFKNLGIIILDEEHEWTYKQDQSPRYYAHEVAEKTADLTGAKLLFASATPRLESMHRALSGEIKLYTLEKRIHETPLPRVEIVDMRIELKKRNHTMFSDSLMDGIQASLAKKEVCILFLNRRGSASASVCRDCGSSLSCKNCDVNLTLHRRPGNSPILVCHHCGFLSHLPENCPDCSSARIKQFGLGTEKIERELKALFPQARIHRADRDTMNHVNSHQELHDKLHSGQVDILIGTQMIAKGLDIQNLGLVGVVLADMGLHLPDFRASERSFQLLTQVAGRAGRQKTQGDVIIQTYNPTHPAILSAQNHNYLGFYEQEICAREELLYPPFAKIIKLIHVNPSKEEARAQTNKLFEQLKALRESLKSSDPDFPNHEIYSAPALIPRKHGKFHWHILIQGQQPEKYIKALSGPDLKEWKIDVNPVQVI
jgi:primosomal protein N' (replication factor Y)